MSDLASKARQFVAERRIGYAEHWDLLNELADEIERLSTPERELAGEAFELLRDLVTNFADISLGDKDRMESLIARAKVEPSSKGMWQGQCIETPAMDCFENDCCRRPSSKE